MSIVRRICCIATVVLLAASCGGESSEVAVEEQITVTTTQDVPADPSEYRAPEAMRNMTALWSAADGVDLFSDEARLVRGARESTWVVSFVNKRDAYPGYVRAAGPNVTRILKLDRPENREHYLTGEGTFRAHILDIAETDTGFTATVCDVVTGLGIRHESGQYVIDRFFHGVDEYNFTQDPDGFKPSDPLFSRSKRQDGGDDLLTWQAPQEDLFVDWHFDAKFATKRSPLVDECRQWRRSTDPTLVEDSLPRLWVDQPPPILPAYPGW